MGSIRRKAGAAALCALLAAFCCAACAPETSATGGNDAASAATAATVAHEGGAGYEDFPDIPPEQVVTVDELKALLDAGEADSGGLALIDVRSPDAYAVGYIDGSRNIPAGRQFSVRLDEIPRDATVVLLIDQENARLAQCMNELADAGYAPADLLAVDGGVSAWKAAGYPLLTKEAHRC